MRFSHRPSGCQSTPTVDGVNILSLDLDFFMHGIAHSQSDSLENRPDDHGITPWTEAEVTAFLEDVLHFSEEKPGKVVNSHHEVFFAWRDGISRSLIRPPFFVCHVDAHSDLGMGLPSWVYLHSDFLELDLPKRAFPQEGPWGLNFGSFMPFAIGNRWISSVDFLASESWHDDIPKSLLTTLPNGQGSEFLRPPLNLEIQLMHAPRSVIEQNCYATNFLTVRQQVGEPVVPFHLLNAEAVGARYAKTKWDFVFLSHSPGYVPASADPLLDVIAKRIHAF